VATALLSHRTAPRLCASSPVDYDPSKKRDITQSRMTGEPGRHRFQRAGLRMGTLEAMRTQLYPLMRNIMVKLFKDRLVVAKREARDAWYSRGYFPHFDGEGVTQHVCLGLFDALPQHVLLLWREELKHVPEKEGQVEWRRWIQDFLDSGYRSCLLRDDRLAEIVQNALLHFDGERYALHGWCVMPNHVHVLFTPEMGFKMSGIAHSWKSFTANQCNRLLGREGSFWQKEPFDRYIRNERHYQNALVYIEDNPVKAGLCKTAEDWLWSSARRR
jgi:REP element-mobilizing transposase RayT